MSDILTTGGNSSGVATRQIMVSLAYLAYCGAEMTEPDPDGVISDLIDTGMVQIPPLCSTDGTPNWTQVWGPVSYTTPGALYQDSMMYVVKNTSTDQYVIAIRGTNRVSDLDWLMDDFDVLQQIDWVGGGGGTVGTPKISESTSIGLQVLLTMQSGGKTLTQFLWSVTGSPIQLWVTGHSLGGCLASALGLYLKQAHDQWMQASGSTTSCVTFAGPTAGNGDFATMINNAFAATTFDRVQCSLDIVPLAWTAANFVDAGQTSSAIFDIYDGTEGDWLPPHTGIDFSEMSLEDREAWKYGILEGVLPAVQNWFADLDYTQPFADQPMLTGTFNDSWSVYHEDFATTAAAFMAEASYQHDASYPTKLGVTELLNPLIVNPNGAVIDAAETQAKRKSQLLIDVGTAIIKAMRRQRAMAPLAIDQDQPDDR